MTDFLIQSTIPLVVLLAIYHLLLEKEKMHKFNRFYLLFGLVFSIVIPFITIEIIEEVTKPIIPNSAIQINQGSIDFVEETNYLPIILWSIYGLITFLLSIRFMRNILKITSIIKSNTRTDYKNAKLVLLKEEALPHTFLNNIFINETDFNNKKIEAELLSHELTHVTQKHTFDILFIEILKTIFWFNPVFIFYKKAIQLNHEFLADEKVVNSYDNIPFYQNLLLSKANSILTYNLTSNLNYSLTKKRLIMMAKTTSKTKAILKKIALIPFIFGLVFFLCFKTIAQVSSEIVKNPSNTKEKPTMDRRDEYYAGVRIIFKDCSKKIIVDKQYEELTAKEKDKYLPDYVPTPFIEKSPSKNEFTDFKNAAKYAIWIDEKHYPNSELSKYSASDFVYFAGSSVKKNARSKKFSQPFQYQFYTKIYFDKNLKNSWKKHGGKEIISTRNCTDKWDKTNNFKESATTFKEAKKSNTQISGLEKYFEETIFTIKDEKGNRITEKKFNELSKEEMKHIPPPPPPAYKRENQTAQQTEDAKNAKGPKSVEIIMSQGK
ncbi:M56 family metallopeptidase [Flavobacterium franklandianum]|uniref:M56 family metallopeptidase n=1 Tax=Flavobacterium franklandianum TaxID=2594430 RepID=UPI001179BC85|nr:M56 family metallopeptidase [Flavobacterium franklandianum]TRX25329.1 M56 family metallopeptidase [Flavobacterium franklandianum]